MIQQRTESRVGPLHSEIYVCLTSLCVCVCAWVGGLHESKNILTVVLMSDEM